jgi:hypothetical protein
LVRKREVESKKTSDRMMKTETDLVGSYVKSQVHPYQLRRKDEARELTVMASAVIGVAGGEVCARWLVEVKNSMNCAVVKPLRRNSGEFSGRLRHGGGGARGRRFAER